MSESKVLFILVIVAVLNSVLQKQYWFYKMQFLVELLVDIESCELLGWVIVRNRVVSCEELYPTNTIKQGILYWTCTGPAVEVIGLAPYT